MIRVGDVIQAPVKVTDGTWPWPLRKIRVTWVSHDWRVIEGRLLERGGRLGKKVTTSRSLVVLGRAS